MERGLEKAEQQFIGFVHAKEGYNLISLVEAMGLTEDEWDRLRLETGLLDNQVEEIDDFFTHKDNNFIKLKID